jgi:hypothetical protein
MPHNNFKSLVGLQDFLNSGSKPEYILNNGYITKGAAGRHNQYTFVVNSNDHNPPHIHISVNNQQIAKYSLETGRPLSSTNSRLDDMVTSWLCRDNNLQTAMDEWQRFHGVQE